MSWRYTETEKPLCTETGNWDGKKSEQVLCEDSMGIRHLATCYEGTMDGSYFFDWYDQNETEIKHVRRWMPIPL